MAYWQDRGARLVLLVGLAGLLSACAGVTPMTSYPAGPQEMAPSTPGVLSGDDGGFTLYERK
jgi:hypothetical protein